MQGGALTADRLGDQKTLAAGEPDHGGGMELQQLQIRQRCTGGVREQQPDSLGAWRVGGAGPQRRGAARAEYDRAGGDDPPVVADQAATARGGGVFVAGIGESFVAGVRRAPVGGGGGVSILGIGGARIAGIDEGVGEVRVLVHPQSTSARALEECDQGLLGDERRQLAHDASAGRRTTGVDDAPDRVAALETERKAAGAVAVEMDTERLQVFHPGGRLTHEDLRSRASDERAPGALGVGEVQIEAVVRGECRG